LFGKSLTGITKSDLINNKNKKNLWVQLTFSIGSSVYILTRGEKPSILSLTKNGEEVEIEGDSRIFQKHLEEDILGFGFKSFKQLVCLGAEFTRFFKMTAAERRTFIEGILDLQVISEMNGFAKEDLKSTKKQLDEYNIQYAQKDSNLKIYEEEQAKEAQNINERREKLLDERQELTVEITKYNKTIVELNANVEHYTKMETDATEKYNKCYDQLIKLSATLKTANDKIKNLQTEKDFYQEHTECPTCKQKIGEEFIKNKIVELDKLIAAENENIAEIKRVGAELRTQYNNYDETKKEWSAAKINEVSHLSSAKAWVKSKEGRIEAINLELDTLNSNKPGGTREVVIAGLKDELADLSTKIKNYTTRIDIYNIILQILSDSGVKQAVISNYIDYINQQLAKYLERFNFNFSVEFDSEFNDTILMDFREPAQYESLSEGQKARLEFCILMVWRDIATTRNSVSTNLLSIDELFDSALDDAGMQDMIDVLKGEVGNIFIISHKNVKSMFEHILEITKEKYGFSELTEL
jgi:DNA repair exonuclease SbcCD ATPase subunit